MFSTLPEEGLSRPAKALLRLLKWAEKEELLKEPQQQNNSLREYADVSHNKDNTKNGERTTHRTPKPTAFAEKDC